MRFIAHRAEGGGPETLSVEEAAVPRPGEGELLLRVLAAGVNRPDVMQRAGAYPPPPGASPVLGLEVAGEVVQAPEDSPFRVGDRVCALVNGGGYAEYCVAPWTQCLPWPEGYDAVRAAALPENYFTVWSNLFRLGRLQAGETVLIHGGSSGIGTTAIQLAHAMGATAYATAGSAEKCATCLRLGAAAAINYRDEQFAGRVASLTDGRGVDVVLDLVGAPYLEPNLESLAQGGRLVLVAIQGGATAGIDLGRVLMRNLTVTGITLRPRTRAFKAELAASLRDHVWPLLDRGVVAPLIHAVLPFTEAARAHTLMESGSHSGKIVLTLEEEAAG